MSTHRGKRPETIGDILRDRIDALGWESRMREEQVVVGWDAAVGPQIAAHARALNLTAGRLTVITESPVWTQQLSLLKPDLIRRIAGTFGSGAVTELYFVTGKIEPPAASPPAPAPRRPAAALPASLEMELAGITDNAVREAVRSLMLAAAADGPLIDPEPSGPGADPRPGSR